MPDRYFLAEVLKKGLVPESEQANFKTAWLNRKKPAGSVVFGLLVLAAFSFLGPLVYRLMTNLKDWGHLVALAVLTAAAVGAFFWSIKGKPLQAGSETPSTLWENSLQLLTALLGQAVIAYLDLKFAVFGPGPVANLIALAFLGSWAYFTGNVTVYGMAMLSVYNLIGLKVYTFGWLDLATQPENLVLESGLALALIGSVLAWFSSLRPFPRPFLESLRLTHIHYLAFCLGLLLEKTDFHWVFCLISIGATVYWHVIAFRFRSQYLLVIDSLIGYLLTLSLYFHFSSRFGAEIISNLPLLHSGVMLLITLGFAYLLFRQTRKLSALIQQEHVVDPLV